MIDIHNHVLPAIDDGAVDNAAALALLRNAAEQGITRLVATPHVNTSHYDVDISLIEQQAEQINHLLHSDSGLPQVALAGEVRIGDNLLSMVKKNQVPFVGVWEGKPALLLELHHHHYPVGTEKLTAWLLKQGILPILAHPERYAYFQAQPTKLKLLLNQGCGMQITGDSLLGVRGQETRSFAHSLLSQPQPIFIASDAHHVDSRPFNQQLVLTHLTSLYGEIRTLSWLRDNPAELTEILFKQPSQCYTGGHAQ